MKAYCVFTDKLEGNHIKLTTEMAQKSRDSMLLIGARVPGWDPGTQYGGELSAVRRDCPHV